MVVVKREHTRDYMGKKYIHRGLYTRRRALKRGVHKGECNIRKCTHGGVYTRGRIYGGVYTRGNVYTGRCTYVK